MTTLVQRLPEGPLDIVGDIHGELEALEALLRRLGCDPVAATHDRHLVFVGDLVDRGPDSPGVVRLVQRLVEAGIASCVAGNHELNVLAGDEKEGNGWYFHHADHHRGVPFDSVQLPADERAELRAFLAQLPLVLERDDLRVVHACYDRDAVGLLPEAGDVGVLAEACEAAIIAELKANGVLQQAVAQRARYADFRDPEVKPRRPLDAALHMILAEQRNDPYRVLTSGQEEAIPPDEDLFFVGGKWRLVRRARWWDRYDDAPAVVVGHYWRRRGPLNTDKPDLFDAEPTFGWTGPRGNVFCVDYSVGRRFLERQQQARRGVREPFRGGLGALRWPERVVVFDDRDVVFPTTGFGVGVGGA